MSDFEKRKQNAVDRMERATDRDMLDRAMRPGCAGLRTSIGEDPLAVLRAEALLVLGYAPDHKGEISSEPLSRGQDHRLHSQLAEATLGRCLIRYLNARARAN